MTSRYMHDDCLLAAEWLEARDPALTAALKEALRTGVGTKDNTPERELDRDLRALNDVASSWACNERPTYRDSLSRAKAIIARMETEKHQGCVANEKRHACTKCGGKVANPFAHVKIDCKPGMTEDEIQMLLTAHYGRAASLCIR